MEWVDIICRCVVCRQEGLGSALGMVEPVLMEIYGPRVLSPPHGWSLAQIPKHQTRWICDDKSCAVKWLELQARGG